MKNLKIIFLALSLSSSEAWSSPVDSNNNCTVAWMYIDSFSASNTKASRLIYAAMQEKGYRVEDAGLLASRMGDKDFWKVDLVYSIISVNFLAGGNDCYIHKESFPRPDKISCYIKFDLKYITKNNRTARILEVDASADGTWNKESAKDDFYRQVREQLSTLPFCQKL